MRITRELRKYADDCARLTGIFALDRLLQSIANVNRRSASYSRYAERIHKIFTQYVVLFEMHKANTKSVIQKFSANYIPKYGKPR